MSTAATITAQTAGVVPPRDLPRQPLRKPRLGRHRRRSDLFLLSRPRLRRHVLDDLRPRRPLLGIRGGIVHRLDLRQGAGGIERGASRSREQGVWVLGRDRGGVWRRGVGGVWFLGEGSEDYFGCGFVMCIITNTSGAVNSVNNDNHNN